MVEVGEGEEMGEGRRWWREHRVLFSVQFWVVPHGGPSLDLHASLLVLLLQITCPPPPAPPISHPSGFI